MTALLGAESLTAIRERYDLAAQIEGWGNEIGDSAYDVPKLLAHIEALTEQVATAWDDGWHAHYLELAWQESNPLHPITKTNPYRLAENGVDQ